MTEDTTIYWNKNTGKDEIEVPLMSRVIMQELYKELKNPYISRDDAIIKIWKSDLSDHNKIIVAVNIGQFKERTKRSRWIYIKYHRALNSLKSYKKDK